MQQRLPGWRKARPDKPVKQSRQPSAVLIRRKIALAKKAFTDKRTVLAAKKLRLMLRLRFLKCCVWPTLLYGCELDDNFKLQEEAGCSGNIVLS